MSARGKFVVIEGGDGVGTTTQARALAERLGGAHVTAEPSGRRIGVLIRAVLGERDVVDDAYHRTLALLFAADRLDHVAREIHPVLASGRHVVSDRYVLSSLVYQGLNLPLPWVQELNRHAPAPDATLVLDVPLDEALRRQHDRGAAAEVFDGEDIQARVQRRYRELAPEVAGVLVDGRGAKDEVTARLAAALAARGIGAS